MASGYFELLRMHAERHLLRQKIVAPARSHGIKDTARTFGCARDPAEFWAKIATYWRYFSRR